MICKKRKEYLGSDLEAMFFAKNYYKWIIDELRPYLGSRVAEVGAGNGNITAMLVQEVDSVTAYEPSSNMYKELEENFSSNSKVTILNKFFGSNTIAQQDNFDNVIYINVMEHVEDDKKEIINSFNALKSGGRILLFVPALSALYSNFDKQVGHFRRYHKNELIDLVESSGFIVDKVKYLDMLGVVPWYIVFVLLKKTFSPGKVSMYDNVMIPLISRFEKLFTPPIGKNLLMVARKPG